MGFGHFRPKLAKRVLRRQFRQGNRYRRIPRLRLHPLAAQRHLRGQYSIAAHAVSAVTPARAFAANQKSRHIGMRAGQHTNASVTRLRKRRDGYGGIGLKPFLRKKRAPVRITGSLAGALRPAGWLRPYRRPPLPPVQSPDQSTGPRPPR